MTNRELESYQTLALTLIRRSDQLVAMRASLALYFDEIDRECTETVARRDELLELLEEAVGSAPGSLNS